MGILSERTKSITKSALDFFLASVVAVFVSVFIYGFVSYPDAPIRRCGEDQFCGKWNKLHTREEFKEFTTWENVLLYSLGFGVVAGSLLVRRRRRSTSGDLEHLLAMQRDLSPAIEERRYAAAWKDLRRRNITLGVFFLLALSSIGWVAEGGFLTALLQIVLIGLVASSILWLLFFRCPRCRKKVFTRRTRDRCPYCGLRLRATFEEAVAELSEAQRPC